MVRRVGVRPSGYVLLLAFAGAGCGGDSIGPGENPLAGLDELAIYNATATRVTLLHPTTEPSGNLRQAVGWPTGPFDPTLLGHTMVYEPGTGWTAVVDDPPASADAIGVVWYQLTGQSVAQPLAVRGHVDLVDQGGSGLTSVQVTITNAAGAELADYSLSTTGSETATTRTHRLDVDGFFGDGTRSVRVTFLDDNSQALATSDRQSRREAGITETGFSWGAVATADSVAATGVATVDYTGQVTVDGITTRLEMVLDQQASGVTTGTGAVFHRGTLLANIAVAGAQLEMTFTRPDGQAYTSAQQARLGTLVAVLLMPFSSLQAYFF
jgi:hypothetical protein